MPQKPAISTQLHPHETLNRTSHSRTPTPDAALSRKSSSGVFPSPASISPSTRYPLTRPLSPDLPTRDALYLFCNFSSYMSSPHEGANGIDSSEDFRDTIRLLDFARSNVHILHLKYRFQGQSLNGAALAQGDYPGQEGQNEVEGKARNPVPQPFSILHDPIVKIDYKENGVFQPLPAQAVFSHVAKCCQPPPRIIVVSYVCSKVTQNHLASLSTWAGAMSPPAFIFSPLETRVRETQPLHLALHHAIPMSMYAWPADISPSIPRLPSFGRWTASSRPDSTLDPALEYSPDPEPTSNTSGQDRLGRPIPSDRQRRSSAPDPAHPLPQLVRPGSSSSQSSQSSSFSSSRPEKQYAPAPVASLTITSDPIIPGATVPPPTERIPLWALAPGVGVLHGSTSASVGVRLADFSARNLEDESVDLVRTTRPASRSTGISISQPPSQPTTRQTSSLNSDCQRVKRLGVPVAPARPITPSTLIPPASRNRQTTAGLSTPDVPSTTLIVMGQKTSSWPSPLSKASNWRKGRREQMEDVLEQIGLGTEAVDLADTMAELATSVKCRAPNSTIAQNWTGGEGRGKGVPSVLTLL